MPDEKPEPQKAKQLAASEDRLYVITDKDEIYQLVAGTEKWVKMPELPPPPKEK